jgi:hypothetical protein
MKSKDCLGAFLLRSVQGFFTAKVVLRTSPVSPLTG